MLFKQIATYSLNSINAIRTPYNIINLAMYYNVSFPNIVCNVDILQITQFTVRTSTRPIRTLTFRVVLLDIVVCEKSN